MQKQEREESKQTQTLPVAGTGWIYCLSNPAMPGLVKVGAVLTNNSRGYPLNMEYAFDDAMDALNSPGVPALFNVEMSELSQDPIADVEFIHAILDSANYRYGILNPNAPPLRYSCARNAHNRDFFTAPVEMVMRAFAECRSRGPNGQITNLQKEETAPLVIMKMKNPYWNREWFEQKTAPGKGGRRIVTKKRRGERRKVKMKYTKKTTEGIGVGCLDDWIGLARLFGMINITKTNQRKYKEKHKKKHRLRLSLCFFCYR